MKYLKADIILLASILLGLSLMVFAGEPVSYESDFSSSPAVHSAVH